jgi:hypothetical protein
VVQWAVRIFSSSRPTSKCRGMENICSSVGYICAANRFRVLASVALLVSGANLLLYRVLGDQLEMP